MLIHRARVLFTGDEEQPRSNVSVRIDGELIAEVGQLTPLSGERVVDACDCIVAPGWVNTHHHFFQSLLKAVPGGIDQPLRHWSPAVPGRYRGAFTADDFRLAVRIALAELVSSGTTTVSDHQFLQYPQIAFDPAAIIFEEAARFGVRMVLGRGGATVDTATPPTPAWLVPEPVEAMIDHIESLTRRYHDPSPVSMRRIAVAPTTLSNRVTPRDLRSLADAARRLGLRLHSHLAETADDDAYCRATHGMSLIDVCDDTGWLAADSWFAHMVHLDAEAIGRLGAAKVGLSHCPQSNARLGSGIADVEALEGAGVTIGMGVDGAASNENANMLAELEFAWLVHRTRARRTEQGALRSPTHVDLVRWATAGGADVLGLRVGRIRAGYPADLSVFRMGDLAHLGVHDPAAGFVASASKAVVEIALCAGRVICERGEVPGLDLDELRAQASVATQRIGRALPLG
jgi:8-oxoguanine deaminase